MLRTIGTICTVFGTILLIGAARALGNHLYEWNLDKISVEWEATVSVAVSLAGLALASSSVGMLNGRWRTSATVVRALAVGSVWALFSVLTYRMNAGYLWLVLGVPALLLYVAVRLRIHFRHVANPAGT